MATLTPLTIGLPDIEKLTKVGRNIFFTARNNLGVELWKTDGTVLGTVLVKDIQPGTASFSSDPLNLINAGGTLFFSADDGINGRELWKSDGTEIGTVLVKDILIGRDGSIDGSTNAYANVDKTVYFFANDNDLLIGNELWKSDGTATGTVLVKDIFPGRNSSIPFFLERELINFNNTIFFIADDGVNGTELWKSDGTSTGTVLVKDIALGEIGSDPANLTVVNSTLFFTADDGVNGRRLWKTDGTTAGTVLFSLSNSPVNNLTNVNGTLFFGALDGNGDPNSFGLWKSDGTRSGTVLIKNFSELSSLTNVNGTLFFTADDGINGRELWKSDGTAENTVLVKDILQGFSSSDPDSLVNLKGTLFFTADDGINGRELWKSDGTAGNTVLVRDINPGTESSSLNSISNVNSELYFSANDGKGERLFKFNNDPNPKLNTQIKRFQNSGVPGTYLFAGESEAANIRTNFKDFKEEGLAFQVAVEKTDPLMQPLFRFQNTSIPGTYLFAGESEAANIRINFKNFKEEGTAFFVYGVGSGQGTTFNRFQNTSRPGTYLFAGPEETNSILANNKNFVLEGAAFEVG